MIIRLMLGAAFALAIPFSVSAKDVEVTIAGGKAPLHGSYRVPQGFARGPAVLMIAGSGPTDRNSDSTIPGVKPGSFRLLADDLERQGIPSLRFDKRSIGASAGTPPKKAKPRACASNSISWLSRGYT